MIEPFTPTPEADKPTEEFASFGKLSGAALVDLGAYADFDAFDAQELMPPPVWDGLGREGTLMLVAGESKSFKSWFAMELTQHAVLSKPLLGRGMLPPSSGKPRKALVLDFELLKMNLLSRYISLAGKHQESKAELFDNDRVFIECHRENMRERVDWVDYCCQRIEDALGPGDVAVVDCLQPITDFDGNAATETRRMMAKFQASATKSGALVILIDHFSKSTEQKGKNRVSGSMAKIAAPDEILLMEASGQFIDLKPILRLDRHAEEITMQFADGYQFLEVDPEEKASRAKAAKVKTYAAQCGKALPNVGQPYTYKEMAENLGIEVRNIYAKFEPWEDAGLCESNKSKRPYTFTRIAQ